MRCDVCGADAWSLGEKVAACKRCGFTRAKDGYYRSDLAETYSLEYYFGGDYFDYTRERLALRKNFSDRLKRIRKFVPSGKLLEIGAAFGYFLELAKGYFDVTGVECNEELAVRTGNRLDVRVYGGPFESIKFGSLRYDVIVALDTIEHIASPSLFLRKCFSLLRSGGFLFVETGDISALLPRLRKENWRLIHPPEHLSYFSEGTLRTLLDETGFEVVNVDRVWFWRTLVQVLYRLYPGVVKRLPPRLLQVLCSITFPLYTGDLIFVTARKL